MIVAPANWSGDSVQAFTTLVDALQSFNLYNQAIQALGINDPKLLQARKDLADLITGTLGPAFRATLP